VWWFWQPVSGDIPESQLNQRENKLYGLFGFVKALAREDLDLMFVKKSIFWREANKRNGKAAWSLPEPREQIHWRNSMHPQDGRKALASCIKSKYHSIDCTLPCCQWSHSVCLMRDSYSFVPWFLACMPEIALLGALLNLLLAVHGRNSRSYTCSCP